MDFQCTCQRRGSADGDQGCTAGIDLDMDSTWIRESQASKGKRSAGVRRNRSGIDEHIPRQHSSPAERSLLRAEAAVSIDEHRCLIDRSIHFEIRIVDLDDPLIIRCSVVNDGPISRDEDMGSSCAENGVVGKRDLRAERQEIAGIVRHERERRTRAQENAVSQCRSIGAV